MNMKPVVTPASSTRAATPPRRALRHVKNRRGERSAGRGVEGDDSVSSRAGRAGRPCSMAVVSMIGSPITNRIKAKGNTQSGSPMFCLTTSTTWRTTHDAPRYTASTRRAVLLFSRSVNPLTRAPSRAHQRPGELPRTHRYMGRVPAMKSAVSHHEKPLWVPSSVSLILQIEYAVGPNVSKSPSNGQG